MALSDFSSEELAEIQFGSGWVGDDSMVIPAKSLRAMQAEDMRGQRQDAEREARLDAHADMVLARFRVRGEQPPTLQDVFDKAGRQMGRTDANAGPALTPEEAAGCDDPHHVFSEQSYVSKLRKRAGAKVHQAREAIHAKVRANAEARKDYAGKPTSPVQVWTWRP